MNRIFHLSDLHFTDGQLIGAIVRNSKQQLIQVLTDLERRHGLTKDDMIILTGDLLESPRAEWYQRLAQLFQHLPCPIYAVPGNHDDADQLNQHLYYGNILAAREIFIGNWVLVLLDSSARGERMGSGRLTSVELLRLETLAQRHKHRHLMVFLHHPPLTIGGRHFHGICLENQTELNDILTRHSQIRALAFGHAHTAHHIHHEDRVYLGAPSTWVQFDHSHDDRSRLLDLPSGYNYYELTADGKINAITCEVVEC